MDHNSSSSGGEHPNAGVVAGLRECADWLEQHPELEPVDYAAIGYGNWCSSEAREQLTRFAQALGDRAVERDSYDRTDVLIEARFGEKVRVHSSASKRALVTAPPIPEPEPIIPARSEAA